MSYFEFSGDIGTFFALIVTCRLKSVLVEFDFKYIVLHVFLSTFSGFLMFDMHVNQL